MEITAVKTVEPTVNYPSARKNDSAPTAKIEMTEKTNMTESGKVNSQSNNDAKGKKELSKEQINKVKEDLNHFMKLIDSDIQFAVHEKSKQLMVQVVDMKENKVIKEFPSHEMLNIMANIKEYVGVLLDKRA